ncbi:MAG: ECF transporter S component [Propionibacteriaceae bacterium]|nr:ECF transporter S component [Propionibacteriaceae bacterium]
MKRELSPDQPLRLEWKSALMLTVLTFTGLVMFGWPFFAGVPTAGSSHGESAQLVAAPLLFILILPLLFFLVLAQLSEKGMDAKTLAILGVLSAVNAALRPLGAGAGGVEVVFFLLILAGRVFGPGFGFVLGCTSIFASALLTAGVGPWMPFQMLASAWIGMGAGLLPQRCFGRAIRGLAEIAMLVCYGIIVAYLFGAMMNLWFWPYVLGATEGDTTELSYIPGGALLDNLKRFFWFTLFTSTAVWDTGRAITNSALLILVGSPVLAAFRRTIRRANFHPAVKFHQPHHAG